ncbi:MAG: MoaD/ThiS family protein [Spirochaetota bacterium]
MEVQVYYFGNFKAITKKESQRIVLSNEATIEELLKHLVKEYSRLETLLFKGSSLKADIIIGVNQRQAKKIDEPLRDNDCIYLFVAMAGGSKGRRCYFA